MNVFSLIINEINEYYFKYHSNIWDDEALFLIIYYYNN
jgi:hypothetical protein